MKKYHRHYINKYYYTDYNGHVNTLDLNILEEKEC